MAKKIKDIFLFGFIFAVLVATFFSFWKIATSFSPDFSVFYYGARDLLIKQNPYQDPKLFTGIAYPPVTLLFFLPLVAIPYQLAQSIWLGLSLLSLLGAVYFSLKICFGRFSWRLFGVIFALALLAFPTKFTFGMGQSNLVALFFLLLSFYSYKNKKLILAGLVLSFVCLLKPILIFFLFFFVLKRAWRIIFTTLTVVMIFLLLSFFIFDSTLYLFYLREVLPSLFNLVGREIYYNQGIMGFLSRHISNLALRGEITFFFSLLLISATFWRIQKVDKPKEEFAVLFPTILLIDTLSWQHHFVWLLFPSIIIYYHLLKARFLKLILFLSYLLVAINFKNPLLVSQRLHPVFLSHVFWGTLIIWSLCFYILKRGDEKT